MPNLTLVDASASIPGLSELVRERTQQAHRAAESRPFIVALMRGELSLAAYADYAAELLPLYEALEARSTRAYDPELHDPALSDQAQPAPVRVDPARFDPALFDPRLDRADALRRDLRHLGLERPAGDGPTLAATATYVTHLRSIDADDLPRYLAHHYTRYLGDLSGGQAIARLMARHYGATPEQLGYYRFDGIAAVPFKRAYREGLDALGFDEADTAQFLEEADLAFAFTAGIFDGLGERWGVGDAAFVRDDLPAAV